MGAEPYRMESPAGSHRTILVIDDDAGIRQLVKLILEHDGFEVLVAEDGLRGLSMAQRHEPDAIVLDLMMPVADGYTVLASLQEDGRTRTIPVVVLSAVTMSGARYRALRAGATAFLTKPFDPTALSTAIDAAVSSARDAGHFPTGTAGFANS